ncbi:DUF3626 domain-containing protein [Catellatospora tritici]|uniref:DUF3626 domain-containing protein n=1 Tax=Catellatospora tritici TaxID=2851566 RepID=UPI001C2D3DFB|nr:DUF3626 domain-containing protein [Catellatospora tritici]MBV1856167.1 DUF3626 domain-containing protein [Catellatospora tritici]
MDEATQSAAPRAEATLTEAQSRALDHIRVRARAARENALATLDRLLAGTGHDPAAVIAAALDRGRITLNFHPDRLVTDGRSVARALAEDGVYRSQFETGISNGGRTAYPGGDRDRWEEGLFGGAYHTPEVTAADRPRYGGLDLLAHPDGACPRFGSCYLRLRPHVLDRATFCFGDSHLGPEHLGTADAAETVFAALLRGVAADGVALGVPGLTVPDLVTRLLSPRPAAPDGPAVRSLDDYLEVQVHGPVLLARDVEAIVADPSFQDTPSGKHLAETADRHGFELHWHRGFELPVDEVDAEFRGPAIPVLARRVHREFARPGALVNAALVGLAAASVTTDPDRWADHGTQDETLQHLKQLWHVLVHFGAPAAA